MRNLKCKQNESISNILITMLIMIAFVFQSCETEIPDKDTEPPKITFIIKGPDIDKTFTFDEGEFNNLSLTDGATYDFIYSVGDTGGLEEMSIGFDPAIMNIITDIPSPWTNSTVDLGDANLSSVYSWSGDRNNPITGNILNGSFTVNGDDEVFLLFLQAKDFGGDSLESNFSSKIFTTYVDIGAF